MLYIWRLGPCFIRDIVNNLPEPTPPYTSVASVVRNLEKKKYVTAKKFGVITQYTPRIRQTEYKRRFLSRNTNGASSPTSSVITSQAPTRRWSLSSSATASSPKRTCRN